MKQFRDQQRIIVNMLKNDRVLSHTMIINKKQWIELLRTTSLDDADMDKWHIEFKKVSPEAHQDFLEALSIPHKEIDKIRKNSATD